MATSTCKSSCSNHF